MFSLSRFLAFDCTVTHYFGNALALKQLWVPKQRAAAQLERLGLAYDANKCLSRDTPNNTESQLIQYYEQQVSNLQQVPRQPKHLSQR